jgi:hypothetical protein
MSQGGGAMTGTMTLAKHTQPFDNIRQQLAAPA